MANENLFNMGFAPYGWDQINLSAGTYTPSSYPRYVNTQAYAFWQWAFYERAISVIDIKVPKEWEGGIKDFLYWCLFRRGFVFVGDSPAYGKIFQPCTLFGFTYMYQPSHVLIKNPYMKAQPFREESEGIPIGEQGDLLKLTPNYMGVFGIINYFAEKMAILDPAINIAITNSKMSFAWGAKSKGAAETIKKIFDEIQAGNPGVVYDKLFEETEDGNAPFEFIDRHGIATDYIVDKLLKDMQTIINQFDTEIGIVTVPYQKAERMVTSEAESKQQDAIARCTVWYNCLKSSIEQIKEVIDIDLDVSIRSNGEEVQDNGETNDNRNGEMAKQSE